MLVRPIAQQNTVAADARSSCASSVICARVSPVTSVTISQSMPLTCAFHSVNPLVYRSMKSWSSASHFTSNDPSAWNSARSPLILMGRCRSVSFVPSPTNPLAFCGFLKATRPASRSGLIDTMVAPFRLAISNADSILGWLVPGFWPATMINCAWWTSSMLTDALPIPIDSANPTLVDSWHMFEQSGRLFVPKARTKSS